MFPRKLYMSVIPAAPTNRIALHGLPHEQNCFTWAPPTNRIASPGLSHEQNCFTTPPRNYKRTRIALESRKDEELLDQPY